MRRNFRVSLPAAGAFREPRVLLGMAMALLLVANLATAAFAFHVFDASPEALKEQLAASVAQQQAEQLTLTRSRSLTSSIDRGKSEGEQFLTSSMSSRRTTYSTIIGEITETAKSAGISKVGATISPLDAIPGSDDLDMMSISVNLEGTSEQLLKFVNSIDRSPRFLIIETLTATPRAKSDILTVNIKLDTFVKEDMDGVS